MSWISSLGEESEIFFVFNDCENLPALHWGEMVEKREGDGVS